ncbi:MAG: M48 family metallopeptidase [Elusimicrobiales bacterium]|nr:M48 family metallopeptidase [Elusimicrobiales bacterium]
MNHGVQFQTLLKSICPDEEKARKWLNDYGSSL